MSPTFSVVLPAYNASATLRRALDSVIAQTFEDWELIVVDDGSSDDTFEVAHAAAEQDSRVTVYKGEHGGCGAARALAASYAKGEYVVKLDADDELLPQALQRLSEFITDEPGYDIYSATAVKVFPDGSTEPFFVNPRFDRVCSLELSDLLDECYIFGGCSAIRRNTLESLGGFRAVYCEDYDLWLRALSHGATHRYTPQVLYRYYFGTEGHMNEDPTKSLVSFIQIFSDLVQDGALSPSEERHALRSIARFESLLAQYQDKGATLATYTNRQARAFSSWSQRVFGEKGGALVMAIAQKMKWATRPLRIAVAKRQQSRRNEDKG